jgi:hypothetical protein
MLRVAAQLGHAWRMHSRSMRAEAALSTACAHGQWAFDRASLHAHTPDEAIVAGGESASEDGGAPEVSVGLPGRTLVQRQGSPVPRKQGAARGCLAGEPVTGGVLGPAAMVGSHEKSTVWTSDRLAVVGSRGLRGQGGVEKVQGPRCGAGNGCWGARMLLV